MSLRDAIKAAKATRAKRSGGLKVRDWKGQDLAGVWQATRKIDGVCVIVGADGGTLSRAGKPLYNVPALPPAIYECYLGSWEASVSALRSQFADDGKRPAAAIAANAFYRLATLEGIAHPDPRLIIGTWLEPTAADIRAGLALRIAAGDEGLVLRRTTQRAGVDRDYIKVKPRVTYDVPVTGIVMGKGKHAGRMGALITPRGNVGTGFSDAERGYFHTIPRGANMPLIIEVAAMGLTPGGKFRHPRFVRVRWDK